MNRHIATWQHVGGHLRTGLAAALLSLALIGTAGTAAAQTISPVDVARAFIAAYNQGDRAALATLADPAFARVEDPRQPGSHTESLAEFEGKPAHVTVLGVQQTGADTVTVDAQVTGASLPPIRVPFHTSFAFTIVNGRVGRMVETVAPETFDALRALGPAPGMPATGRGPDDLPLTLLGLGLLSVVALLGGVVIRQRRLRGR